MRGWYHACGHACTHTPFGSYTKLAIFGVPDYYSQSREQAATNIISFLLVAFSINVAQPSYFLYSSHAARSKKRAE
jgi:hypothetical protein